MLTRSGVSGQLRRAAGNRQRGTVTAEIAVGLPGLVLVLTVSLWGVAAMAAKIACVDAARAGARAAARGEPLSLVRAGVVRAAPAKARVVVRHGVHTTSVVVTSTVRVPLAGGIPALTVRAAATADTEPGGSPRGTGSGADHVAIS